MKFLRFAAHSEGEIRDKIVLCEGGEVFQGILDFPSLEASEAWLDAACAPGRAWNEIIFKAPSLNLPRTPQNNTQGEHDYTGHFEKGIIY